MRHDSYRLYQTHVTLKKKNLRHLRHPRLKNQFPVSESRASRPRTPPFRSPFPPSSPCLPRLFGRNAFIFPSV